MKNKELWLMNSGTMDVHLSDLAVKVWANKTVNIYALSPYLTEEQINKSMESGSIKKRLDSGVLKIVKGNTKKLPDVINKIKESKEPILVRKTKSSVVVEHTDDETIESDGFDFADYGLSGLEAEISNERGTVVVQAKQDESPTPSTETELAPKVESSLSNQSAIVMRAQQKGLNNPVGKIAPPTTNSNQPFVVTPPSDTEVKEEVKLVKPDVKKSGNSVLVGQENQTRSLKQIAAEQKGETVEEDSVVKMEKPEIDTRVATKTEDGAIVMEMKEVPKTKTKKKSKKSKPTT